VKYRITVSSSVAALNDRMMKKEKWAVILLAVFASGIAVASFVGFAYSEEIVPPYVPSASSYEAGIVNSVKLASPAVVSITITKNVSSAENCPQIPPDLQRFFGSPLPVCDAASATTTTQKVGEGSGFIVSPDGWIVTNKHVVEDPTASYAIFANDGKKYNAVKVAQDPKADIAIIKIDAEGLPTVTLGDSDSVVLGQAAIAIGNALGQFSNTVSAGVISGMGRAITATDQNGNAESFTNLLQTDAAINPGNSGGPLLNLRGEVIGMNTALAQNAENIGFAIPINAVKGDVMSVETTGKI